MSCSRSFLQKLIVAQLVNKFLAFHGTQTFIAAFTKAGYWPSFWPDETTPLSIRSILFFHLLLGAPTDLHIDFVTKILHGFLFSLYACCDFISVLSAPSTSRCLELSGPFRMSDSNIVCVCYLLQSSYSSLEIDEN
jgi:hypothetical protein